VEKVMRETMVARPDREAIMALGFDAV